MRRTAIIAATVAISTGGMTLPHAMAAATAAYQQQEISAIQGGDGTLSAMNQTLYQIQDNTTFDGQSEAQIDYSNMQGNTQYHNAEMGYGGPATTSLPWWAGGEPNPNIQQSDSLATNIMYASNYDESWGQIAAQNLGAGGTGILVNPWGIGPTQPPPGLPSHSSNQLNERSTLLWTPAGKNDDVALNAHGGYYVTNGNTYNQVLNNTDAAYWYSPFLDRYGTPNEETGNGNSVLKRISWYGPNGPLLTDPAQIRSVFTDHNGYSAFEFIPYDPATSDTTYGDDYQINTSGKDQYMRQQSVFQAALSTGPNTAGSTNGFGSVFVTDDIQNGNVDHSVFLDKYNDSYLDDITSNTQVNWNNPESYITQPVAAIQQEQNGQQLEESLYSVNNSLGLANLYAATQGLVRISTQTIPGPNLTESFYTLPFSALESQVMLGMPGSGPQGWYEGPDAESAITGVTGNFPNYFAQAFFSLNPTTHQVTPYLSALIGYPTTDQTADANDVGNEMNTVTGQISGDWSSLTESLGNQANSGTGTGSLLDNQDVKEALPMLLPVYTDYIAWATPVHGISTNSIIAPYQAALYATAGGNSGPEYGETITTTQQEINGNTFITVDPTAQTNAFTVQEALYPSTVQPSTGLVNPTAPGGSNVMYAVMTGMQEGFLDWDQTAVPDGGLRPLFVVIWTIMLLLYTLRVMNWALTGGPIPIITFTRTPDAPNTDLLTRGPSNDNPGLPGPGNGGPPRGLYGPQLGTGDGMIDADYRVINIEELPGGNTPKQLGGGT